MKFRRRPIIIDAVQWWSHEEGQGNHHKVTELADRQGVRLSNLKKYGWLETSMGGHRVKAGDWIIQNHNGEYSSCNPETFERLYELDDSFGIKELPRTKQRDRSA